MISADTPLPITDHLRELRRRAFVALLAVAVCASLLLPFASKMVSFLSRPLLNALAPGARLVALTPFEAWYAYFKIAMIGGLVLAAPIVCSQLFAFASPAIERRARRVTLACGLLAGAFFIGGASFCYLWVLPAGFAWAASFTDSMGAELLPRLDSYLSLSIGLIAAFGLAFELPLAVALLMRLGIVSRSALSRARPYAIVGAFIVGAVLTPPDVISQTALAIPLIILYEAGILLGRILSGIKSA
ncbi:MAG: twin-arginine translocase subunit TatC [bacterium]